MKAVLELLNSLISSAEVPGFLIEMVCVALPPIFTSPKSTEDGVVTTAFEAFGENALELDPQPVSPMPRKIEEAKIAIAPIFRLRERAIESEFALRCFLNIRSEEQFRLLRIKRHLHKVIWCFGQPMQKGPPPSCGDHDVELLRLADCRIDPAEVLGTGDDSPKWGMY